MSFLLCSLLPETSQIHQRSAASVSHKDPRFFFAVQFMDPLARCLHLNANPSDVPSNAFLADGVILYSSMRKDLRRQLQICTTLARTNKMSWNPRKCFIILQNTPSPSEESNIAPFLIDNSPLKVTQSHEYLSVTLSAYKPVA